jgi:hypothetical protein
VKKEKSIDATFYSSLFLTDHTFKQEKRIINKVATDLKKQHIFTPWKIVAHKSSFTHYFL